MATLSDLRQQITPRFKICMDDALGIPGSPGDERVKALVEFLEKINAISLRSMGVDLEACSDIDATVELSQEEYDGLLNEFELLVNPPKPAEPQ